MGERQRALRTALRQARENHQIVRIIGVHDCVSSILAERAGYDALWESGLGVSTVHGLPDAGILTLTELFGAAQVIRQSTCLPIITDCDGGYGDANVLRRLVALAEHSGVDAICVEDKKYPKRNSFVGHQVLEEAEVFAAKIDTIKMAQSDPDLLLVARIESLIAGAGIHDALKRAHLYQDAGADAILIHSRASTSDEVVAFLESWNSEGSLPVLVIPTTYPDVTSGSLAEAGAAGVVYANQLLRSCVSAMQDVLASLTRHDSTAPAESRMAPVREILALCGTSTADPPDTATTPGLTSRGPDS